MSSEWDHNHNRSKVRPLETSLRLRSKKIQRKDLWPTARCSPTTLPRSRTSSVNMKLKTNFCNYRSMAWPRRLKDNQRRTTSTQFKKIHQVLLWCSILKILKWQSFQVTKDMSSCNIPLKVNKIKMTLSPVIIQLKSLSSCTVSK